MRNGEYEYKTKPFAHQREGFTKTRDLERFALFWEQGVGKTKPTIDTAAYLFEKGEITGVVVIAPNGVHQNWHTDEIPTHIPERIPWRSHCYHSSRAGNKASRSDREALFEHRGLSILCMTYDAVMTKEGEKTLSGFLESRKCLFILDEAARIKSPNAKRTKRLLAYGKYAKYRRILTGTPVANSPFDVYSQMKFLNAEFWKPHYLDSFYIFKHHFGVFQKGMAGGEREFEYVVAYRNLEQLQKILEKHSSRLTKEKVLDLPPKLYQKRYFELTSEQKRIYEQLEEEFMAMVESGDLVTAPLAITRLLRFQQVVSGYIPMDEGGVVHRFSENPRISLLADIIEDVSGKVITWAKFTSDIDSIVELYKNLGRKPVRYDGQTSPEDRLKAREAFQKGDATDFVANPAAAGEGLTLHAARTVIYYNNSYKLTDRLQSEDRAHRIGQNNPVTYIDLVAKDTVDEMIVDALVKKSDLSATLLGDKMKEWIRR